VYLYLNIIVTGIFDLITTIYSWESNADSDVMLQKVLTAVSKSDSRLEGLDNEFLKWINTTKLRTTEEDARLVVELNRWNALLKVLEECGASQSLPNRTDAVMKFGIFETKALPQSLPSPEGI